MSGMLPGDKSAILNMQFSEREQAIQELSANTDTSQSAELIAYAREIQREIIDAKLPTVEEFAADNELREKLLEHLKVERHDDPISCELSHRLVDAFIKQQIAILQAAENVSEFKLAQSQVMDPYIQYEKQFEPTEDDSKKARLEAETLEEANRVRARFKIIMYHIYLAKTLHSLNFTTKFPNFIKGAVEAYRYFFLLQEPRVMALLGDSKYSHFMVANAIITPILENFNDRNLSEILATINSIVIKLEEMPLEPMQSKEPFIKELREQLYNSFIRLINDDAVDNCLSDGDYVAILQLVKMHGHIRDPDIRVELYDIVNKFCTGIIEMFSAEVDDWEDQDLEVLHGNLAKILEDIKSIAEEDDDYYENRETILDSLSKVIVASLKEQTNQFLVPNISIPHALSYNNEEAKSVIDEMLTFLNTIGDNYSKIINDPDDLQELLELSESIFEPTIEYLSERSLAFSTPLDVMQFNRETIKNIKEFIGRYSPAADNDNMFSQLKLTSHIKILQNLLGCFNSMANKSAQPKGMTEKDDIPEITLLEDMLVSLKRIKPKRRSTITLKL